MRIREIEKGATYLVRLPRTEGGGNSPPSRAKVVGFRPRFVGGGVDVEFPGGSRRHLAPGRIIRKLDT